MIIKSKLLNTLYNSAIASMLIISSGNIAWSVINYEGAIGAVSFPNKYNIEIKPVWSNCDCTADLNNAISAWNNSDAYVWFNNVKNPTEKIYITIKDFNYGNVQWDGKCYPSIFPGTQCTIHLNDYKLLNIQKDAYFNRAELISHEMGHTLKLKDNNISSSIMLDGSYKNSPEPSAYDIECVNSLLPMGK